MDKKGMTLVMLMLTIITITIILSASYMYGISNITKAEYRKFVEDFEMFNDNVNLYIIQNDKMPSDNIFINLDSMPISFQNSVKRNNDDLDELYVINSSLLNNNILDLGEGTIEDGDVFVIAKKSENIYYVQGKSNNEKMIHSLSDILSNDK